MTADKSGGAERSALQWASQTVRDLPPYKGPTTFSDYPDPARRPRLIHLNESPYPPSPRVAEAIAAAMHDLNRYPNIYGRDLVDAIARDAEMPAGRIVLGCGSDELIQLICQVALAPGDEAVVPAPSFPRYGLSTRLAGAQIRRVALDAGGACDAAALLAAIGPRTRLVFCCTPNPPSGGMMGEAALRAVVEGVPDNVLLYLDEAYFEFGRHAGGPDTLALLRARKGPWLSTRTFSKAYALAALRVGYAICGDDSVAQALRRVKLQFNVPTLSQAAALAAYRDQPYLSELLDRNAAERQRLADGLAALGVAVLPSAANFVSCVMPGSASAAMVALETRGILVRDWRDPAHLCELRIGVGLAADTDATLGALADHLAGRT